MPGGSVRNVVWCIEAVAVAQFELRDAVRIMENLGWHLHSAGAAPKKDLRPGSGHSGRSCGHRFDKYARIVARNARVVV